MIEIFNNDNRVGLRNLERSSVLSYGVMSVTSNLNEGDYTRKITHKFKSDLILAQIVVVSNRLYFNSNYFQECSYEYTDTVMSQSHKDIYL